MKMTDELWIAMGFQKEHGWGTDGWVLSEDKKVKFFPGLNTQLGHNMPETLEELMIKLKNYWKNEHLNQGREQLQCEIKTLLGIE